MNPQRKSEKAFCNIEIKKPLKNQRLNFVENNGIEPFRADVKPPLPFQRIPPL